MVTKVKIPPPSESLVPKSALASKEEISKKLALTEKKQEQIEQEQKKLLKLSKSRARLNKREVVRARGVELERHHKNTNNHDGLAEALAMQGRFREASEIAVREDLRAEYQRFAKASEIDDTPCDCDKITDDGTPTEFIEKEAYSEKHGAVMAFIGCSICGELNARPKSDNIILLQNARSKAVETKQEIPLSKILND